MCVCVCVCVCMRACACACVLVGFVIVIEIESALYTTYTAEEIMHALTVYRTVATISFSKHLNSYCIKHNLTHT